MGLTNARVEAAHWARRRLLRPRRAVVAFWTDLRAVCARSAPVAGHAGGTLVLLASTFPVGVETGLAAELDLCPRRTVEAHRAGVGLSYRKGLPRLAAWSR